MKAIHLWSVDEGDSDQGASIVPEVQNTETEAKLEELLVASPELLMNGLVLVGRQVPTDGGPLDLLGFDEDGRLVVFELKRGTLTRDAVAQSLDYASDLFGMEDDRLGGIIEEYSGRLGIDKIEDFADWYSQRYPNSESALSEAPRIVLVGLGADDRARRVVNFLASASVDIQLLTFHAFCFEGRLLLARLIESVTPASRGARDTASRPTKESNLQALRENAAGLNVGKFIEEVGAFLEKHLPAYKWPGKTGYTFALAERTERGTPTLRQYVSVYLDYKQPGSLQLVFPDRAVAVAGDAMSAFRDALGERAIANDRYKQIEARLAPETWPQTSEALLHLLPAIVAGWKAKSEAPKEGSADEAATDGSEG